MSFAFFSSLNACSRKIEMEQTDSHFRMPNNKEKVALITDIVIAVLLVLGSTFLLLVANQLLSMTQLSGLGTVAAGNGAYLMLAVAGGIITLDFLAQLVRQVKTSHALREAQTEEESQRDQVQNVDNQHSNVPLQPSAEASQEQIQALRAQMVYYQSNSQLAEQRIAELENLLREAHSHSLEVSESENHQPGCQGRESPDPSFTSAGDTQTDLSEQIPSLENSLTQPARTPDGEGLECTAGQNEETLLYFQPDEQAPPFDLTKLNPEAIRSETHFIAKKIQINDKASNVSPDVCEDTLVGKLQNWKEEIIRLKKEINEKDDSLAIMEKFYLGSQLDQLNQTLSVISKNSLDFLLEYKNKIIVDYTALQDNIGKDLPESRLEVSGDFDSLQPILQLMQEEGQANFHIGNLFGLPTPEIEFPQGLDLKEMQQQQVQTAIQFKSNTGEAFDLSEVSFEHLGQLAKMVIHEKLYINKQAFTENNSLQETFLRLNQLANQIKEIKNEIDQADLNTSQEFKIVQLENATTEMKVILHMIEGNISYLNYLVSETVEVKNKLNHVPESLLSKFRTLEDSFLTPLLHYKQEIQFDLSQLFSSTELPLNLPENWIPLFALKMQSYSYDEFDILNILVIEEHIKKDPLFHLNQISNSLKKDSILRIYNLNPSNLESKEMTRLEFLELLNEQLKKQNKIFNDCSLPHLDENDLELKALGRFIALREKGWEDLVEYLRLFSPADFQENRISEETKTTLTDKLQEQLSSSDLESSREALFIIAKSWYSFKKNK